MDIEKEQSELYKKLIQLDVNSHTEEKNGLTYLSWAWAWQEFKRLCPDAVYEVKKFTNAQTGITLPYIESEIGYMVFTSITAKGVTHEMWLPVMDGANKTMKKDAYTYQVKIYEWNEQKRKKEFMGNYEEKRVDAISMFDVNKTIMRCLTKNIAMFGLGLYIYAGEDLPIEIEEPCTEEQLKTIKELEINEVNVCKKLKINKIENLTYKQAEYVIETKKQTILKDKEKKENE